MTQLVFFLEEPSAREMLKGVLPRMLPGVGDGALDVKYVVFEGKQDLEKRLPMRLRAWQRPDALFLVMRDQDNGNGIAIKKNLVAKCAASGQPTALVRIACRELESFYLGDLDAVARALGPANLGNQQDKANYRAPDSLPNPAQILKKIAPNYQKVSGSRAIGKLMKLQGNKSNSFNVLIDGIQNLLS